MISEAQPTITLTIPSPVDGNGQYEVVLAYNTEQAARQARVAIIAAILKEQDGG